MLTAKHRLLAIASAVVLVVTGCSSPERDQKAAPVTPRLTPFSALPRPYSFPLDRFVPSGDQRAELMNATNRLKNTCAATHGVELKLPEDITFTASQWKFEYSHDVRPADTTAAAHSGYHLENPSPPAALQHAYDGLSHEQINVTDGWLPGGSTPRPRDAFLLHGGCDGRASQTLYGTTPENYSRRHFSEITDLNFVTGLIEKAAERAAASSDFRRVLPRWSECMRVSAGIRVADPIAALSRFPMDAPVSQREVEQAAADITCKRSTGLLVPYYAAMLSAERTMLTEHRSKLQAVSVRLHTWLSTARRINGG